MPPQNHALWLQAKLDKQMVVAQAEYPSIAANELIIKTTAVAINPADWVIQRAGVLLETYPAIIGFDVAGTVQEVGANLAAQFKPGDRVFGAADLRDGYKYSAFQEYVVLRDPYVAKIPDGVRETDAVVLPWGVNTAASCLFGGETLGMTAPPRKILESERKTVLVWGASSSVGVSGVQLAKAAGYDVVAVASEKNFEMLKSVGAGECYDYHDDGIVDMVAEALKGTDVVGAYDAISEESTIPQVCEILAKCGGRKIIAAVKPAVEQYAKEDVEIRTNFPVIVNDSFRNGIGARLWKEFLPAVLEAGQFRYKPDAEIVGNGLEKIQEAVNLLADRGVSARKLVVML